MCAPCYAPVAIQRPYKRQRLAEDYRFAFLALPTEVRLLIYEYVVAPNVLVIDSYQSPLPDSQVPNCPPEYQGRTFCLDKTRRPFNTLEILRTCKLIRDEATPIACRPRELKLEPLRYFFEYRDFQFAEGKDYEQTIVRPSVLSHVFRLESLDITIRFRDGNLGQALAHSRGLADCLNAGLIARRISLGLEVPDDEHGLAGRRPCSNVQPLDLVTAGHIEVLRLWKTKLTQAHLAERVQILCTKRNYMIAAWTKERGGDWEPKERKYEILRYGKPSV